MPVISGTRKGLVALLAMGALGVGTWAVVDAQGMPVSANGSQTQARTEIQRVEDQAQSNEAAVLAGANTQGQHEIAALALAQKQLSALRQQLTAETQAATAYQQQAQSYRAAALQATERAQQLAAQLQGLSAVPRTGGDYHGGGDD